MEVILQQHMPGLGNKHDIVTVKRGYGANYLIPEGFAILATTVNKKIHAENVKQATHKQAQAKEEAQALGKGLGELNLVLQANASTESKAIYGTITPLQVAQAFAKHDIKLHPKQVVIPSPIKELGTHEVTLKLHQEVATSIRITVEAMASA